MKSSDRAILIVLPLIALAIGFYLLVLAPKQREAGELQDKVDSLSAEIQTSESAISSHLTMCDAGGTVGRNRISGSNFSSSSCSFFSSSSVGAAVIGGCIHSSAPVEPALPGHRGRPPVGGGAEGASGASYFSRPASL